MAAGKLVHSTWLAWEYEQKEGSPWVGAQLPAVCQKCSYNILLEGTVSCEGKGELAGLSQILKDKLNK